jgi:hypothetical protein
MLGLQMRRAPSNVIATAIGVGGVDLSPGEAERRQQIEDRIIERARRDPQAFNAKPFAERPFVGRELDVESGLERRLGGGERPVIETLSPELGR